MLAAALATMLLSGAASRAAPVQPVLGLGYRLVDTWESAPWTAEAGRFARAGDLTVLADGRHLLLDDLHNAVHVLDPAGAPLALWSVHGQDAVPRVGRIDAAPDGGFWLLSWRAGALGQPTSQLDRFDRAGQRLGSWRDARPFADLAVDLQGRVYVTVPTDLPRVLRLDAEAREELAFGRERLQQPGSIDVAPDGRVYVVNRVTSSGPGSASPTPGPAPTREPSARGAAGPAQGATATAEPPMVEGVLVFGAGDHAFERAVEIGAAGDLTSGPAGTFVSRELEILPLAAPDQPVFSLPYAGLRASGTAGLALHLDQPGGAGLAASLWHCYFQGLLRFARAEDAPTLHGGIDRPLLAGPAYPVRLSAGDALHLLQGRFSMLPEAAGGFSYHPAEVAPESEPQSVQRWQGGHLEGQLGVCAGHPNAPAATWARDLAADGARVYTLDPAFVRLRRSPHFPDWSYWAGQDDPLAGAHRLEALDAAGGRVAVLDLGAGSLLELDDGGRLRARESLATLAGGAAAEALPVDLALAADGTRLLADAGGRRLLIEGPGGASELALHDRPRRVASGPDGAVFVLGRGGMVYRYAPAPGGGHALEAAWTMPQLEPEPLDLDVGPDGRVYVAFVERGLLRVPRGNAEQAFLRAGTWVFEPVPVPLAPPPAPEACLLAPDKRAAPERLRLGERVEVTLEASGLCPGAREPIALALVLDRSRSMAWDGALGRAQEAAIELLQQLDPRRDRLALVAFDAGGARLLPIGADLQAAAAAVSALEAGGDTRVAEAIELATEALAGLDGRRVILVLGDGGHRDDPGPAVEAARAAGIELWAWIFRTADFPGRTLAAALTGGERDRLLLDPEGSARRDWFESATDWQRPERLLEQATVIDRIPANMRYVAGSARPAARYEAAERQLVWTLGPLAAGEAIGLRYELEPLATGRWPTNVEAWADYRDGLGRTGRLVFPIPEVEVLDPPPPAGRVYLPLVARGVCLERRLPLDLTLVVDSSQSMAAPTAGGESKLAAARAAALGLVDRLDLGRDRVAVIGFDQRATVALGLSADRERIGLALAGLVTAPGTRLDQGLGAAWSVLAGEGRPGARPVVVFLTDGLHGGTRAEVLLEADRLRRLGSLIYTIGLGERLDRELLEAIAEPPGSFFASPAAEDLETVFQAILARVACDALVGGGRP